MTDLLVILFSLAALVVFFAWYLNKKFSEMAVKKEDTTLVEWIKATQEDIKNLQQTLHDSMQKSNQNMTVTLQQNTKDIHDRLTRAAEVIGELKREAGAFSEVGRSMKELQEFLKSPKLRGNIGERVLNDLIGQMFPKQSFFIQYKFRSGNTVDAAIKTDAGILPIDSKFPMENFQKMAKEETEKGRDLARKEFIRNVRNHIDAISSKYILPEEGTMDFALMYVPSESVYYEIVNMNEVMEYARTQRVYIVSPSTLYAHLQTILLSFEGKNLEQKSREVLRLLHAVKKDYGKALTQFAVLGKHVTNAYNSVSTVSGAFSQLGQKLESTDRLEDGKEKSRALPQTSESVEEE